MTEPYQNIFYFYRGPKSKRERETNVDFQLENNTTKALINTLYHSEPKVCKDFISRFFKIDFNESSIKYALQKKTIGAQKIEDKTNKIVLGIYPKLFFSEKDMISSEVTDITDLDNQDSLPDAWIWDSNSVILIESKTRMKFDKDQLKRHGNILASPTNTEIISWEEIHSYFKDIIENKAPDKHGEIFLIKQFVQYLELINLSKFSGWKKEDFEFFFFYDEREKVRLKNKMVKFTLEILSKRKISDVLEIISYSRVGKDSVNIWCRLDAKDPKFRLSGQDDQFLNFTLELCPNHFQVSIVFPVFPSIKKLKKVLSEKENEIINQFESIFREEITNNFSHEHLKELIKERTYTIPNYKIRIFDQCFINIGDRHWLPRAEITIDTQTLPSHEWFDFLQRYVSIYYPKDSERDSGWGAGLHILKEYPRGSEILEKPDNLIEDVQNTILNFYKFVQIFIN